ncbi:hypothetical protein DYL61_13430 [Pseudomonas nabeulensis]|uniref:DUF7256 domain-containing protein n=1 Tax=Pseudomonas nabeulensis TaxID=2293833 RepID=A0A4Z0B4H6_9PSED|nr:hypothetical protein DYL61_13430 [Pseudomonas nabeulensis]
MPASDTRLDYPSLALLRPGHTKDRLQAALGASWSAPCVDDDGWWRPARYSDGFMARIGDDDRLLSVWFYGNFSMRCQVEGLNMRLPLESALGRKPQLSKLETASGPRSELYYMNCVQGYRLIVQFNQNRIRRLFLEALGQPSRALPPHLRHL